MTMAKVRAKVAASKVQSICKRKANSRIEKALTSPSLRYKAEPEQVLMCSTKYQKVGNEAGRQIHAVQRMRGRSQPPNGVI